MTSIVVGSTVDGKVFWVSPSGEQVPLTVGRNQCGDVGLILHEDGTISLEVASEVSLQPPSCWQEALMTRPCFSSENGNDPWYRRFANRRQPRRTKT